MKKTIIAMLALSGVAFGATADEVQDNLKDVLGYTKYQQGTAFSLTLQIGNVLEGVDDKGAFAGSLIKFTEDWSLWTQGGWYLGFESGNNGISDTDSSLPGSDNTGTVSYKAFTTGVEGWFYDLGAKGAASGLTITLSSYGNDAPVSFGITKGDNYIVAGCTIDTIDLNSLVLNNTSKTSGTPPAITSTVNTYTTAELTIGGTKYDLTTAPAIPEPTTATLSLLALAGLAARRRRK